MIVPYKPTVFEGSQLAHNLAVLPGGFPVATWPSSTFRPRNDLFGEVSIEVLWPRSAATRYMVQIAIDED